MSRVWKFLCVFLLLISSDCIAKKKLLGKFGEYQVYSEKNGYNKKAVFLKNKKKLYELTDYAISIVNYDKKLDLIGGRTKILVVKGYSGGSHCCNSYYLLELGDQIKNLQTIETADSDIKIIKQTDKSYLLSLYDVTFNYFYASYAASFAPLIYLSYNGEQFTFDQEKMTTIISDNEFNALLHKVRNDLASSPTEQDRHTMLVVKPVIELIYSGNGDLAWKLIDDIFTDYAFKTDNVFVGKWVAKSDNDEVIVHANDLKRDIIDRLALSPYSDGLRAINQGKLEIPVVQRQTNY